MKKTTKAGLVLVGLIVLFAIELYAAGFIADIYRFKKVATPAGNPPSGEVDFYIDSTTGLPTWKDSAGTVADVSGGTSIGGPLDTTVMWLAEEFCSGDNTTGRLGNQGWKLTNFSSGAWTGLNVSTNSILQRPCVWRETTAATIGSGGAMALASNSTNANINVDDLTSEEWEMVWIVKFSSIADVRVRAGMIGNENTLVPNTSGMFIRYDTEAAFNDDAKGSGAGRWVAQTCSTCTGDTSGTTFAFGTAPAANTWYRLRIRRLNTGVGGLPTIYMQVNSGTEVTFCSSGCDATLTVTTNAGVSPTISFGTDAATAKTLDLDYFGLQITGLTRF